MGQHFAAEPLEGDSQYRCEPCGGLRDAQRVVQVTTPPDNLIVGLNRFCWDFKSNSRKKVHTKVAVARELVLPCAKPFANYNLCTNGAEAESPEVGADGMDTQTPEVSEACEKDSEAYELYAIVVHSGSSAQSGHYYCYAKTAKTQDSPWYLFNDQNVSQSSFEAMQSSLQSFERDTPYILFYRRIGMAELQGEDVVHPLLGDLVTSSDANASGRQQAGS